MTDTAQPEESYRLRRESGGFMNHWRSLWRRRWFRWASWALAGFLAFILLFWLLFVRNLPDAAALAKYEPPLPTIVRDAYGEPVHSYARERRVELRYGDLPKNLVGAYLSAEDKTFFEHGGLDYPGIASALFDNIFGGRERARGASTITQQVAKNVLLTNEYSYTRKVKEAILAYRIEGALSKEQILTLYLNEIPLGRRTYGVQAAAQAYFGKDVAQLELQEMAFLAILPKAPEVYGRSKNAATAMARRNWVLGEMEANGYISATERAMASAKPLGLIEQTAAQQKEVGGYFLEEVRRKLIDEFGEDKEDGPFSVYSGGLWVRSSLDTRLQKLTTQALRDGLMRYHAGKGWKGPINTLKASDGDLASQLASSNISTDYRDWKIAVVTARGGNTTTIAFADKAEGRLLGAPSALNVGDIIAVSPAGGSSYNLRTIPEVGGAMLVQNPHNGRIMAMQGGFDSRISSFNRATQAMRQPGSTIKPFVYATALDQGMTPATIIVDGKFCVYQSAALGRKCFTNFGGAGGAGPQTMRWGLEQSRNLMTVRAANDAGMPNVIKTFKAMNIGEYNPYLSFALGAGDTTVEKMVNAYSSLVNHGKLLNPTVIDFVQDRRGKVIWPKQWKPCKGCNMKDWDGQPMPRFASPGKQAMDPITAYQVVHMLEGVIQRGTATTLLSLGRPIMGKTGTTTGPTNVWFVGGSPDLIAGVYLGFDQPRNMGGYAQGGSIAAPIFKQFAVKAYDPYPIRPFIAPKGTRMVRIERTSGRRAYGGWPSGDPKSAVIWEAFKPDTEPKRSVRSEEIPATTRTVRKAAPRRVERAAVRDNGPREAGNPAPTAPTSPTPQQNQNDLTDSGIY